MQFRFFPGSELSPAFLLGKIVCLERPQDTVANLILTAEGPALKITHALSDAELKELHIFVNALPKNAFRRTALRESLFQPTHRRAMC